MPVLLSHFIDASRWIGALIVLGVHSTNMFVSLADINTAPHGPLVWLWWFFVSFNLGHQAVIGFFVLSGYLVGGSVIAGIREGRDFLREYLIHRMARIYIVVAPALVLTLVFDSLGRLLFAGAGVYDWPAFADHFRAVWFLASLANLQEIWTPYFGVNGPLWSLACEFWYYLIFPFVLLPFARNYPARLRWGGFALGVVLLVVMSIPSGFFKFGAVLWALGGAASMLERPPMRSRYGALAILAVLLILIRFFLRGAFLEAHPWLQDATDFVQAAAFLNVLLAIRFGPPEFVGPWAMFRSKTHVTLANFSFSLYSIHMPLLIFARAGVTAAMGEDWVKQLATPAHWALLLGVMALITLTGYAFGTQTEGRTGAARRWLRDRLPFAPPPKQDIQPPPTTRATTRAV